MKPLRTLVFSIVLAVSLVSLNAHAGVIQGTTTGSTVMAPGIANHPMTRDDMDTATTINVTYFRYCPWIATGAMAFPTYNFVFAGIGPIGSMFTSVDPGDFTIAQYKPWVVNNNPTMNNISGPNKVGAPPMNANYNRGVTGQDSGGADIVVYYTPLNAGDPTKVNFVQAFIQNTNNAGVTAGKIDNGPATTPYYNDTGVAGTGTTVQTGTIGLTTSKTTSAWLVDIPYRCENGPVNPGGTVGCLGGVDDTLTSQVQTFQTFIESNQTVDGKTYQVLYGGVQWGYSLNMVDTPEPSSILLFGSPVFLAGLRRYVRRRN